MPIHQTYWEIADIYSVSVATADRAVALLHNRGLAVGQAGRAYSSSKTYRPGAAHMVEGRPARRAVNRW